MIKTTCKICYQEYILLPKSRECPWCVKPDRGIYALVVFLSITAALAFGAWVIFP
jgi:hypothetical protein